jgi:hypothetical protein
MTSLGNVVQVLKNERDRLAKELQGISAALAAFGATYAKGTNGARRLSAAGRARIAAAQKARWAKLRKERGPKKNVVSIAKKRTLSAAGRKRIAEAQRARWAKVRGAQRTA